MSKPPKVHVPKTDEELREDLRIAQENYNRTKGYHTAIAIQQIKRQLEVRAFNKQQALRVIEGSAGSHDLSDVEVMTSALREIVSAASNPADIGGTLLHVYNVSKHALKATGRLNDE